MAETEVKKNDDGMDILKCCRIVWMHKIVIVAATLIMAALMLAKTAFFTDYTYTSYGLLNMYNRENTTGVILNSDIEASKQLNPTYIEILQTRAFLQEVSDEIDGKYTAAQISKMLNITAVDDTTLLKVSVKAQNPKDAQLIAQTILDKSPTKLTGAFEGGVVKVVDPAQEPSAPNSKGYLKNLVIGAAVGLVLGLLYAFIREFLDKKVHSAADVASRYGVSVLGETDVVEEKPKRFLLRGKASADSDGATFILNKDTDFGTIEAYKSIRTNIMFSTPKQELGKVIAVTSSVPAEGKTTTAINLAVTFAQTGARILLIDCDLRRAKVHRYLHLERKEGVSNVVCGYSKLDEIIQRNVRENLDCITAGENSPNPSEILQADEFGKMIEELQGRYDYIFLDTPPITVVTDAAIVVKHCAGAVIVIRNELTRYDLLDTTVNELENTGCKILGAVVHGGAKQKRYGYYGARSRAKNAYRYAYKPSGGSEEN